VAVYAIGDIQGCVLPFEELLEKLEFDPETDQLWVTGDLVNRGPDSLQTLRLVRRLGDCVTAVLGNHDLHFLAIVERIRRVRQGDTLKKLLKAPDIEELAQWMRHLPLAHCDKSLKTIMVHAGVYPGWKRKQLMGYAQEVESILRGEDYKKFLRKMYGRRPAKWNPDLGDWDRYRFIINTLTRMRYCDRKGNLNFTQNGPPGSQPRRYIPWFEHSRMKCRKWRIVFGHWSALGYLQRGNIISLDSGCVWGGKLTAIRLDGKYQAPCWQLECGG
jgi:bis(5'-nucleosyl)-tetraphosphatase (symmetrical)